MMFVKIRFRCHIGIVQYLAVGCFLIILLLLHFQWLRHLQTRKSQITVCHDKYIVATYRLRLLQLNELCVHFRIFGRPEITISYLCHADDLLHESHHSNTEFNENTMLMRVVNECYHKNQKVKQKYVPYIIAYILFECSVTNVFQKYILWMVSRVKIA